MRTFPARFPFFDAKESLFSRLFSLMLSPAGNIFGHVMSLRRKVFEKGLLKSQEIDCKVVSIGNLFAGGTGKTQVVSFLSRLAVFKEINGAVISGGYGGEIRRTGRAVEVLNGISADVCGDEAVLLASLVPGLPVYAARNRADACKMAIRERGVALCILDDAAQHLSIKRDVDIYTVDAGSPFGNGRCLPAGPLRETASSLCGADVLWIIGNNEGSPFLDAELAIRKFNKTAPVVKSVVRPVSVTMYPEGKETGIANFKGLRVCAFCAIARHWRFLETLENAGLMPVADMSFPDHHTFDRADIKAVREKAGKAHAALCVTTAKDDARSRKVFNECLDRYGVLNIDLEILSGFETIGKVLE